MTKKSFISIRRFLTVIALVSATCSNCYAQFNFFEEGYRFNPVNKNAYRLTPQPMNWTAAQAWARSHSIGNIPVPGNLVTIRDKRENDWLIGPNNELTSLSPLSTFWIGFTEASFFSPEDGVWMWVSGEPGSYRSQDMTCTRYCNFLPGLDLMEPAPDVAIIRDTRGENPGFWLADSNASDFPQGPWYGIVEFVEPFVGAHEDSDGNRVPDTWEDRNQDGVPDGFENGGLIPFPRNLQAGGGVDTVRLIWEPADSTDLLGYNIYRSQDPDFGQPRMINEKGLVLDTVFVEGLDTSEPVPGSSPYYYQIESVLNVGGTIQKGYSNIAVAQEEHFVASLPDIRIDPTDGNEHRYPISLINARGVDDTGFALLIKYPSFLLNVTAESTPLTREFPDLDIQNNPSQNTILCRWSTTTQVIPPLNGEGALLNLVFDVTDTIPISTQGTVSISEGSISVGPGISSQVDLSDTGTITIRPNFKAGDVDGSGAITNDDAIACASLAFGVVPQNPLAVAAGDINGDGIPDISDVNQIIAILIAKEGKENSSGNKSLVSKGPGNFEIKMKDTTFPTLPGSVDMEVEISTPPAEGDGIAGAAFTVSYATEHVELAGVELDGAAFNALFYDQRDYSRGWKEGRVKVIVSSGENKVISGKVAKVKFDSKGTPSVPSSDVPFVTGKMAKSSGEDIAWTSLVDLEKGTLIFPDAPGLDINVFVDNVINAKDLLIYLDRIKNGTESGEILNEFSKEWLTPR